MPKEATPLRRATERPRPAPLHGLVGIGSAIVIGRLAALTVQAEAEAHALTGGVDADNPSLDSVALSDHLFGVLDALIAHLGDMDEALDAILDAGEGAEGGELGNRALDHLTKLVALAGATSTARSGCA